MKQNHPDPTGLVEKIGLQKPIIGFYDAPDCFETASLVEPRADKQVCIFSFFKRWMQGQTLHLCDENPSCIGAGYWLCGTHIRPHKAFVLFLAALEGLKASYELVEQWLSHRQPYQKDYNHLLIGPLREAMYPWLKTVTFFVDPDQLGALVFGVHYHVAEEQLPLVTSPFGSGCMQMASLFDDSDRPQAIIGTMDPTVRMFLPPGIMAFTVNKPMFERLCELDGKSFLDKPLWKDLRRYREKHYMLSNGPAAEQGIRV